MHIGWGEDHQSERWVVQHCGWQEVHWEMLSVAFAWVAILGGLTWFSADYIDRKPSTRTVHEENPLCINSKYKIFKIVMAIGGSSPSCQVVICKTLFFHAKNCWVSNFCWFNKHHSSYLGSYGQTQFPSMCCTCAFTEKTGTTFDSTQGSWIPEADEVLQGRLGKTIEVHTTSDQSRYWGKPIAPIYFSICIYIYMVQRRPPPPPCGWVMVPPPPCGCGAVVGLCLFLMLLTFFGF